MSLSRYQRLAIIGQGGCGQVFLAEDHHRPSKRKCIVKQLTPLTNDPEVYQIIKERFIQEAVILEEVGQHPQIPDLYALFEEDNEFYLVQEYFEGETITQRVKNQKRFDETFVIDFFLAMLPLLSYLHAKGIIHRDIKPDNIIIPDYYATPNAELGRYENKAPFLVRRDKIPVLIDFGIIKEIITTVVKGEQSKQSIIAGSSGYAAPEQMAGYPTFSSDLFSLGMTAIYMLTGENPNKCFNPTTRSFDWNKKMKWSNKRDLLEAVIRKASQFHTENRYFSAEAMLHDLLTAGVDLFEMEDYIVGSFDTLLVYKVKNEPNGLLRKYFEKKLLRKISEDAPEYHRYLDWDITLPT